MDKQFLVDHTFKIGFDFYQKISPFKYCENKYKNTFLKQNSKLSDPNFEDPIKRVIWCFWTGDNELTENRLKSLEQMKKNVEIPVKLITPENLQDYILKSDPLPDCYEYLSHVHKADYLRTYFMHYYGGGYSDIKPLTTSWINSFELLEKSNCYALGYGETSPLYAGQVNVTEKSLKRDLLINYNLLLGPCSFICRPQTKFTEEWLNECKKRLEYYSNSLKNNPATDPFGKNENYPIPWSNILAEIMHPLSLKYKDKLIKNKNIIPICKDYR